MTASTLNMHYTIADPAAFGITDYEPVLPLYTSGQSDASEERCSALLRQLSCIAYDKLSPENAFTYTLLRRSLENDLALAQFPYYKEPLSPSSGMQSQLPVLLAEYTFRTGRDVTDYLALLDQVDDYFASLLLYEQEKAAAGFLMPDVSLEKVRKQCDTIVTIQELTQGTHFLQTTFEDRLVELQAQGILSAEAVSSFLKENDRLLTTVVQPAYDTLSEGLYSLEASGSASQVSSISQASPGEIIDTSGALPKGLALLPDGKTSITTCFSPRPVPLVRKKNWYRCFWRNFRRNSLPSATWQSSPLLCFPCFPKGSRKIFPSRNRKKCFPIYNHA